MSQRPTKLNNDPDFSVYNWGNKKINLTNYSEVTILSEMVPTECHIKMDGDLNGNPSLLFVFDHFLSDTVLYGQISLKMFKPVIDELKRVGALE